MLKEAKFDKNHQSNDLRIIRLTNNHIEFKTKNFQILQELLFSHQETYPDIDRWFAKKVIPELKHQQRIVYLGLCNEEPVASAVLKIDDKSKFCHLHIEENSQNIHLGEMLFSIMSLDAKRIAKEVHFTLPESLWEVKKEFFKSFGFTDAVKAHRQYRLFDEELRTSASFATVWQHVLQKLPKLINSLSDSNKNIFNGVLMSIKPKYIETIKNKEKTVEIRRKFNKKLNGRKIILYATAPEQALCGFATIENIVEDYPDNIWSLFKNEIGSTEEEFYQYTQGSNKIYAIIMKDIETYFNNVYLNQVIHLLEKEITPPQSYLLMKNNPLWAEAVSIAELLHNRFRI